MIIIARIFEAWRDTQIFENPTKPRGFLWHLFKFPQFSLLIFSMNIYFLIVHFGFELFNKWYWGELLALGILIIDVLLAWVAFELFLKYFRGQYK